MKYLTTSEIRQKFLDFFIKNGHYALPSASLIPVNDNSLLWINSGVAALKPYFDGRKAPPHQRLVNSQKALRTNDIENVGYTAKHHTLFEMLGNFSIGDYFKKEAIVFAWEFLTSKQWLGIDANKLIVTVFLDDTDTIKIWKEVIGLDSSRIILGSRDTNFWDMGQGPCGPNTEIFYDRGIVWDKENYGLKLLQDDIENDRYLEIWNIVFSDSNNDGQGNYHDLPRKNIDTGAGLERLACIIQEVPTNFETDLFLPIIEGITKLVKVSYDPNNIFEKSNDQTKINVAFKVISDHIRAISFAIGDGVFPSNKDRGYVIRRLIRRAMVYGHKLHINEPFLYKLVIIVVNLMKDYYPHLEAKEEIITSTVKKEEEKFFNNLKQGLNHFNEMLIEEKTITTENAFKLYDTYGFPIDLTIELASEKKITIDLVRYNELLEAQRKDARNARSNQQIEAMDMQNKLLLDLKIPSIFIGYEVEENPQAKVVALFYGEEMLPSVKDDIVDVILDATPFYAEKGGQANDTGIISNATMLGEVIDVKLAPNKQHIHRIQVNGTLKTNDIVCAVINHHHRNYGMKNHSGTHLLHSAIREILGADAMQISSFNNYQYLRLDIAYNKEITTQNLQAINNLVTKWIAQNDSCEIYITSYDEAIKMNAMAFFNEKYDKEVRVVKFGNYSIELCGGTHVKYTGDIEQLLITSIESKGSGIYRFQALTSTLTINNYYDEQIKDLKTKSAEKLAKYNKNLLTDSYLEQLFNTITSMNNISNATWKQLRTLYYELQIAFKKWEKKVEQKLIKEQINQYQNLEIISLPTYNILIYQFNDLAIATLKLLADKYRLLDNKLVIIFTNKNINTKNSLLVVVSESLIKEGLSAVTIVKSLTKQCQGSGGGNMQLALGGFNNEIKMQELLQQLKQEDVLWNI
ncbi:alanine--tRNA ligase [Spiroplasma endosymbiont of Clivina fossor]|uniref:alanine--tRNA ligase n=1 Tax=Spiroplasma endosymbiont of Clivina fossor TaxID=3066282 RepID=UPI00313ACD0C